MVDVLVVNSGSSSIKYQLIDLDGPTRRSRGQVERIGHDDAVVTHGQQVSGKWEEQRAVSRVTDHDDGLAAIIAALHAGGLGDDVAAVGHRVVHGGDRFVAPTVVDDDVEDGIAALVPLAPLHNPANLAGIRVARRRWPQVPQVAVFDTAFHATLRPAAFRYAVPEAWYRDHGVRRYGMHGTSHAYVARRAADILDRPPTALRLITAHLGNGASITAVAGGRSVDTSMGMSPLEGLIMGTRSGDIDPAVVFHLARTAGMAFDDIEHALNAESGLKGLCGDNDLRTIEEQAAAGDEQARLAFDMFCYRIRKYVGGYAAALGGLDALVFTAGIGEHSATVRARVCDGLGLLGITLDAAANEASTEVISATGSGTQVLVVPTDEEIEIATQTLEAISSAAS